MPMVHPADGQNPAIKAARWLAVLPGAVAAGWAAWVAWVAISLLNRLTFSCKDLTLTGLFRASTSRASHTGCLEL